MAQPGESRELVVLSKLPSFTHRADTESQAQKVDKFSLSPSIFQARALFLTLFGHLKPQQQVLKWKTVSISRVQKSKAK